MSALCFASFFPCDPLSLFFVFVILIISFPSLVFSIGYLKNEYSSRKIALSWILSLGFIFSMLGVVTTNNGFFFLIMWELMSLISYFLVVFDSKKSKSIQAGTIYIIMTHIGTTFIIAAILMLFNYSKSFDFIALQNAAELIPSGTKNLIFLFLLIGFGTKAGIVPLHIWLPYAHPQAPSHISSIMSGVMIKTAIYGLLRFVFIILGINALWWGVLVIILAAISCIVGVVYALIEHDIKKLLAYHSVENIGIILLGIGASMIFLKMNIPSLAILALIAGLYHLINHAIFKSLLFLCAGSIYKATGSLDIEKLGGLIKKMPYTTACFLIGAMAISALPPLNGFVSEWLTLQALFLGALNSSGFLRVFLGIAAASLALTGGLAAACFVKAFGITFLSLSRSKKAEEAVEVPFSMKFSMVFLSILAVLFGLLASPIVKYLSHLSQYIANIHLNTSFALNNFTLIIQSKNPIYLSTPLILLLFLLIITIAYFIIHKTLRSNKVATNKTWDCGYYNLTPRCEPRFPNRGEYTATGFSKPFRLAFSFFLLPQTKTEKIKDSFYHTTSFKHEISTTPFFNKYIYSPILYLIMKTAKVTRKLQSGSINVYIAYIFATILLLIIFMEKF